MGFCYRLDKITTGGGLSFEWRALDTLRSLSAAKPVPPVAVVPDAFPDHMRVSRVALGWSQAKLARNAGIDKRSVGRYEAGLVAPSIQAAAKLAVTLGKSLDVMTGFGASPSDPQASALLAKLQLLPTDRRDLVLALVKVLGEK